MSDRVGQHIRLFNAAVREGDWTAFLARFAPDAVMTFEGVPAGPYVGLAEIAGAYRSQPPSDTMTVLSATRDGEDDIISFAWDAGGRGVLRISWDGEAVAALAVVFDRYGQVHLVAESRRPHAETLPAPPTSQNAPAGPAA